ncbi:MAG: ABC transporter, partial [Myxococcota bacterium]
VALIIAVVLSMTLYFLNILRIVVPAFASLLEWISISYHLEALARGVIDSRNVLYYVTLTVGALFLAERSVARQHA